MKLTKIRPAVIVLALATALTVATGCSTNTEACAATTAVSAFSPPEPITDGSYRDGSYEENETPPEPIEDDTSSC